LNRLISVWKIWMQCCLLYSSAVLRLEAFRMAQFGLSIHTDPPELGKRICGVFCKRYTGTQHSIAASTMLRWSPQQQHPGGAIMVSSKLYPSISWIKRRVE
jgi:hypothetical protein